jgi:hypothetical protein
VLHGPSLSFAGIGMTLFLVRAGILCHLLAICTSLLALIMVAGSPFLTEIHRAFVSGGVQLGVMLSLLMD